MGGALYQKNNSSYYQKQYCLKHISNFHSITAFTKRSIQTSENKKHQEKVVSTVKVGKKKKKTTLLQSKCNNTNRPVLSQEIHNLKTPTVLDRE